MIHRGHDIVTEVLHDPQRSADDDDDHEHGKKKGNRIPMWLGLHSQMQKKDELKKRLRYPQPKDRPHQCMSMQMMPEDKSIYARKGNE
jgi:hypothetical protein